MLLTKARCSLKPPDAFCHIRGADLLGTMMMCMNSQPVESVHRCAKDPTSAGEHVACRNEAG